MSKNTISLVSFRDQQVNLSLSERLPLRTSLETVDGNFVNDPEENNVLRREQIFKPTYLHSPNFVNRYDVLRENSLKFAVRGILLPERLALNMEIISQRN